MDLNRLRYFSVVAETGSIRTAAELLHISPTALSKAVKVLEREVGVQLVRAQGRGIALTDEGRMLARRAGPVLADLARLPAELTTQRAAGPTLRYASHEVFGTYFTRPLLERLPSGTSIEHRYLAPGDIEAAVLTRASDIGITYIPMPTTGLDHRPVAELAMGTWGLPHMATVPFDELAFAAPVQPTIGSTIRAQSLDGWPDDRVPRTVRHRITTTEAALELCRQGAAVARFPNLVVALHNRTAAADQQLALLPDPPQLDARPQLVYTVTRTGDPRDEHVTCITAALGSAD
jgi:DNA-binding transcriptional LysR family regulator